MVLGYQDKSQGKCIAQATTMFAHLRVKIEAWRLRGALCRCVLCGALGVANGTRAPVMHDAIAPMPTMFSYPA